MTPAAIRVAIVEDQTMVLGALAALLERAAGIVVVAQVRSGAEALEVVATLAPDVLIADIEMPGMSGLELADRLKGSARPRIIMLTTFALLLRAWSIRHLGEFFTVDVAVAPNHRLIESGPYKRLRHPSYTGVLIVVAGMGLCFGSVLSILALLGPFAALAIWRMRVEEEALANRLGSPYREYMQRTKRLIPGIY